jgi:hypothetical protein
LAASFCRFFRLDLLASEGYLCNDSLTLTFQVRPPTFFQAFPLPTRVVFFATKITLLSASDLYWSWLESGFGSRLCHAIALEVKMMKFFFSFLKFIFFYLVSYFASFAGISPSIPLVLVASY